MAFRYSTLRYARCARLPVPKLASAAASLALDFAASAVQCSTSGASRARVTSSMRAEDAVLAAVDRVAQSLGSGRRLDDLVRLQTRRQLAQRRFDRVAGSGSVMANGFAGHYFACDCGAWPCSWATAFENASAIGANTRSASRTAAGFLVPPAEIRRSATKM